jgi:hypothetical protein
MVNAAACPVVISSARNVRASWAIDCIESVARQTVLCRHVYSLNAGMPGLEQIRAFVAAMPPGQPRPEIREYTTRDDCWTDPTIGSLDPETVVIALGGDDYLLRDDSIAIVMAEHNTGALVTYGGFEPVPACNWGWWRATPHTPEEIAAGSYRAAPWRASHLATFRAGLCQRIKPEDFRNQNGEWCWLTGDQATMLPMLEMAAERATFIATPIVAYRVNNPASAHNTPELLAKQAAELAHVRSHPRYDRIEWPPRKA